MKSAADRAALLSVLRRESVRFGTFELASGRVSNVYVDARLSVLRSDAVPLVGRVLFEALRDAFPAAAAVGGMAAGAIPLVTAVVFEAGARGVSLSGFFVRKAAKEHGRGRRVEGVEGPSGAAVVLEDTATTGASALAAALAAREAGFEVSGAIALIDREMGAAALLAESGVRLESVFRLAELTGVRAS